MRIEITAVHLHDGWASDSRAFIGMKGEANWVTKTPGVPGWSKLDFTPEDPEASKKFGNPAGNIIFFAMKYIELPEEGK